LAPLRLRSVATDPEVEDIVAERDGFLIVSKREAGAEFVEEHS